MSEVSFALFITLVEFDQETNRLLKEIETTQVQLNLGHALLNKSSLELHKYEESAKNARLMVKEKEAQMESLDDRQRTKEKQLESVSSSKEYASLTAEIEKLKKAQHTFEPELEAAWKHSEKETSLLKGAQVQYEIQKDKLKTQIDAQEAMILKHKEIIEQRNKEREHLLVGVPSELLEKYKGLQTRITNPIVTMKNGACSYCAHILPAQQINRIHLNVLEQCKNCFRFLYELRGA